MKILLAVDGSPCSQSAAAEVSRRPWPPASEVKVISAVELPVVTAIDPWTISPDYFEDAAKAARQNAQAALETALSTLRAGEDGSLKITSEMMEGSPKRVIIDEAEAWGADLIVVGSHGKGVLDRFLLGSISQAVALHAGCSVEIVRSREACRPEKK